MYTKKYVEQVLKVNGLSPSSSDAEIKNLLAHTCCNLDTAFLAALRDPKVTGDAVICGTVSAGFTSTILTAEQRLRPNSIKDLLGIDVEINYADLDSARSARQSVSIGQIMGIAVSSLLFAGLLLVGVMWYFEVGFFHTAFR